MGYAFGFLTCDSEAQRVAVWSVRRNHLCSTRWWQKSLLCSLLGEAVVHGDIELVVCDVVVDWDELPPLNRLTPPVLCFTFWWRWSKAANEIRLWSAVVGAFGFLDRVEGHAGETITSDGLDLGEDVVFEVVQLFHWHLILCNIESYRLVSRIKGRIRLIWQS